MEDGNLILESIKFMVLGMSVVFLFLTILVVVVNLQAKLIAKFFPEEPSAPTTNKNNDKNDAHHVAAIVSAVTEFRKKS